LRDTGAGEACLSPLDVVLDVERNLVVQPDLSVVLAEPADIVTDRIWGAPDLVVEVMSPRPRIGSIEERLEGCHLWGPRMLALAPARHAHRVAPLRARRRRVDGVRANRPGSLFSAAWTEGLRRSTWFE
jgi:hypothetical protein